MVRYGTAEAKLVAAFTDDGGYDDVQVALLDAAFNSIYAIGRWTPFEVFFVVDVCSCEKLLIPRQSSVSILQFAVGPHCRSSSLT